MLAGTGLASVAGATVDGNTTTGIEICKTTVAPTVNSAIPFTFTVTPVGGGTSHSITAPVNTSTTNMICSAPLWVGAGQYTVTEDQAAQAWNKVNSITAFAGQSDIVGTPNLSKGSAVVTVTYGSVSGLTYSDSLVTGYVEVCKAAAANSGLVAPAAFNFTLTGGDGYTGTTSATVGECSSPVQVPAGTVQVVEGDGHANDLYVSGIASTTNSIVPNSTVLSTGTTVLNVAASTSTAIQSDVTYTNNVVTLKVCKYFSGGTSPQSSYPFTYSVAGANAADAGSATSGSLNVPVGGCQIAGVYPAGSVATVTEGVVPGTKVGNIVAQNGATVVPTTLSLTGRSVQVVLGNGTGEGLVNYWNIPAAPGELKLCVNGTVTGSPSVSFLTTWAGNTTGTTTVVNQGQCVPVGGVSNPTAIPFNSTVKVVGTASAGNVFVASTVPTTPTDVWEVVNGVLTDTGVPTVVPPGAVISPANVETESVIISEGLITEVSYTDPVAAPATLVGPVVTTPGPATVVSPVVSTSNTGSTSVSSGTVNPSTGSTSTSTLITTPKVLLTKAQMKAELKKFNKELTNLKGALKADTNKMSHLKGQARSHEAAIVKKVNSQIKALNAQIKALNKALK